MSAGGFAGEGGRAHYCAGAVKGEEAVTARCEVHVRMLQLRFVKTLSCQGRRAVRGDGMTRPWQRRLPFVQMQQSLCAQLHAALRKHGAQAKGSHSNT